MTLRSRLARLETGARDGLTEITIRGGFPEIGPDDLAHSGDRCWRREASESVEAWRARVLAEARSFGVRMLVWGGLPD